MGASKPTFGDPFAANTMFGAQPVAPQKERIVPVVFLVGRRNLALILQQYTFRVVHVPTTNGQVPK